MLAAQPRDTRHQWLGLIPRFRSGTHDYVDERYPAYPRTERPAIRKDTSMSYSRAWCSSAYLALRCLPEPGAGWPTSGPPQ